MNIEQAIEIARSYYRSGYTYWMSLFKAAQDTGLDLKLIQLEWRKQSGGRIKKQIIANYNWMNNYDN